MSGDCICRARFVRITVTLLSFSIEGDCLIFGDRPMSACYEGLGCLNLTNFYDPKLRFVNAKPWPRAKIDTRFLIYTPTTPYSPDIFSWNVTAEQLRRSSFDPSLETKVFAHGFLQVEKVPDSPMRAIKDALLTAGDFNVILVDWADGSLFEYVQATANTRIVGLEIARLVEQLQKAFGVTPDRFHVIGHSLGSHIAGYAGQRLRSLGRITGLDPAEPFFQGMPPTVRLDPSDADFVDVIHTDGKRFMLPMIVGFGMIDPVGHIDFYPNGGVTQPGCERIIKNFSLKNGPVQGFRDSVTCPHERAKHFMAEALDREGNRDLGECAFVAYACSSYELFLAGQCTDCGPSGTGCAVVGLSSIACRPREEPVKMYFKTNQQSPFCLYHYHVVVHVGSLESPVAGKLTLQLKGQLGEADLALSTKKEYFNSGSRRTYLSTTEARVGGILEGTLNFLAAGNGETGEFVVQRVEISLMNDVNVARYRRKTTVSLTPMVQNGAQTLLSRCDRQ
ncbi:pancreatic triacylglycerol lipase-like [Amblyomma americanum]